jgi:hypothetical protein
MRYALSTSRTWKVPCAASLVTPRA